VTMLRAVMQACLSFGNQCYTLDRVAEITGMERKEVRHRLWKLENAGLISRLNSHEVPKDRGRPVKQISYTNTIRLTERIKSAGVSSKRNGWDKMWQAVRVLRNFTRSDLASICEQSMMNVIAFTKEYQKRGYLRCLGGPGQRNVMWMLAKDAGPHRPMETARDVEKLREHENKGNKASFKQIK
jgi:hypothetical protein